MLYVFLSGKTFLKKTSKKFGFIRNLKLFLHFEKVL